MILWRDFASCHGIAVSKKEVQFMKWLNRLNFVKKATWENKATPYIEEDIINIDTGLAKQFRHSPKFKNVIAETKIKLTGSRRKDYLLAESQTNSIHIPNETVWHHVWEVDEKGYYTMQLISTKRHFKTFPHAGGVKLWLLNNQSKSKYTYKYNSYGEIYVNENQKMNKSTIGTKTVHTRLVRPGISEGYNDYVIDYIVPPVRDEEKTIVKKKNRYRKRDRYKIWGYDPYGNVFVRDNKGDIYFYDHEEMTYTSLGISERELLRNNL